MIKCSKRAITRHRTQGGHEIETSERSNMGLSQNWLRSLRKKLLHPRQTHTHREIVVIDTGSDSDPSLHRELIEQGGGGGGGDARDVEPMSGHGQDRVLELLARSYTEEDEAAVKIQAAFRGHLARRASRALRSLVRLQALARGAYVRKQAQIALQCMHVLARLQVRVRARQLLGNFDG